MQVDNWPAMRFSTFLLFNSDKFKPVNRAIDKPLRITVSDVFKGMGGGFNMTGKIVSGCVQNGDRVLVMPVAEYAAVKGMITSNGLALTHYQMSKFWTCLN